MVSVKPRGLTFHHWDLWDKSCSGCASVTTRRSQETCRHFLMRERYRSVFEQRPEKVWCYAELARPFQRASVVDIYAGSCGGCRTPDPSGRGCLHVQNRQRFERLIESFLGQERLWPELTFVQLIDDAGRRQGLGFDGRRELEQVLDLLG